MLPHRVIYVANLVNCWKPEMVISSQAEKSEGSTTKIQTI